MRTLSWECEFPVVIIHLEVAADPALAATPTPATDVPPALPPVPHLSTPFVVRVYLSFLIPTLVFFSVLCSLYFYKYSSSLPRAESLIQCHVSSPCLGNTTTCSLHDEGHYLSRDPPERTRTLSPEPQSHLPHLFPGSTDSWEGQGKQELLSGVAAESPQGQGHRIQGQTEQLTSSGCS